jgi:LPS export ABC transporter protein LptC
MGTEQSRTNRYHPSSSGHRLLARMRFLLLSLLLLLLLLTCSFDYEEAMVDESLAEETPESILVKLSQTVVEEGRTIFRVEADTVEIYQGHKKTVAQGLHFLEYADDGSTLTEGWADRVVYFNETEDAEFMGNVNLYSKKEKILISTDSIRWESETRHLETPPETKVSLKKDDGSFLEGVGLEADLRRMEIRLKSHVRGRYVTEE